MVSIIHIRERWNLPGKSTVLSKKEVYKVSLSLEGLNRLWVS